MKTARLCSLEREVMETTANISPYIINEVSYISGVGQAGSDGVLRLSNHRSLVHSAHPRRLVDDVV